LVPVALTNPQALNQGLAAKARLFEPPVHLEIDGAVVDGLSIGPTCSFAMTASITLPRARLERASDHGLGGSRPPVCPWRGRLDLLIHREPMELAERSRPKQRKEPHHVQRASGR